MNDLDQLFQEFIAAFNALDFERFRRCLAAEVSLYAPGEASTAMLSGASAVESHFASVFRAEAPAGPNIRPVHIRMDELAAGAALITFEFARARGSTGRRTLVCCRGDAGWQVRHIHASNTPFAD